MLAPCSERMKKLLEDAEWGDYLLVRLWEEPKFVASLRAAENTPRSQLKPDGNRAVIYCSTTDPYQVIHHPDPARQRELANHTRLLVRRSLELIRDRSTLNVRILTRSPLARADFDLFRSFGKRLVFGMSLPTLRNDLARVYEPKAPAPEAADMKLPHAVSLYHDFAGAIDNIYASLVAWLVLAKEFGKVRLWSDRAFDLGGLAADGGFAGLKRVAEGIKRQIHRLASIEEKVHPRDDMDNRGGPDLRFSAPAVDRLSPGSLQALFANVPVAFEFPGAQVGAARARTPADIVSHLRQ